MIAPDLRGHGDSEWSPGGDYTMPGYIYDLAQLIQHLDLAELRLVGHSLGGNIALRYSGLFPRRVARIAAIEGLGPSPKMLAARQAQSLQQRWSLWLDQLRRIDVEPSRPGSSFDDMLKRMRDANAHLSEEQVLHLTTHGARRRDDGTWSWKYDPYVRIQPPVDLHPDELHRLWHSIECPTLLCYGEDSWASNPAKDGRASHFRNARVATFAGAGHWLHHDQREAFMTEVGKFLADDGVVA